MNLTMLSCIVHTMLWFGLSNLYYYYYSPIFLVVFSKRVQTTRGLEIVLILAS